MSDTPQTKWLAPSSQEHHDRFFETDTVKANLKSKSIRGGAFMLTSGGACLVITLASTSVLARILMPSDFGLLGMVFALTAIAEQFKDIGLGRATIQKKELNHSEVSNLFWLNAAVGIGISLLICLSARVIAGFYHEQRLTHIALALSVTFLFGGLTIQHQALLNRRMRFLASGAISTGAVALSNGLAILLALKGFGYWSLVYREIARSALIAIGTFIACPWVPGLPDRQHKLSHHMRFARHITVFNLVTYFTSSVDQILLGRFAGASALGIYRQAFQLVMLPLNQITSPVQNVSEPLFSALQDDAEKYKRGFQKTVSALSLVTMPLAAGIFMCSTQIVTLLLGHRWMAAVEIIRILAIAAFLRPAISTIGFVMISCGKTARYMALGILDSIALTAAVSVGVLWGARGVAVGHVVATYVVFLPFVWWALKGTPVELTLWLRSIARPLACSLIMVAVLYVLQAQIPLRNGFAALSLSVSVGAICYFAGMLALPGGRVALSGLLHDLQSAVK